MRKEHPMPENNETVAAQEAAPVEVAPAEVKNEMTLDDALAALKSARSEAAKHRSQKSELNKQLTEITEWKQQHEQAQMSELEKMQATAETYKTQLEQAQAENRTFKLEASLNGKVADTKAALKLIESQHYNADGSVNIDALTSEYPFLGVKEELRKPTAAQGSNPPATRSDQSLSDWFNASIRKRI